ncbi:MAG: hypothetical protein WCF98_10920 [Synechococcus sp. ELA057]
MNPRRSWITYSIVVAAAGSLLKRHTPNFGWCQIYPSLQSILEKTHSQLFFETLGSLLRPSLHIEKALGHACGMGCVNLYYYTVYFAALLVSTSLLSRPLFVLAGGKTNTNLPELTTRAAKAILFSLPIYLIVYSYGSIVDAIYPASIIGITYLLLNKTYRSASGQKHQRLFIDPIIPCLAALSFLADMSRPYAPYIILILIAAAAAQKNPKAVIGLATGILLALPYHTIQAAKTGSPMLTNYTGCNLMEVFHAPGTIPPGGMATTPQTTIATRCAFNQANINYYIVHSPVSALRDLTNPPRLLRSALPAPFTPWEYDGFPGFSKIDEIAQWALWAALIIFLYLPTILLVYTSLPQTLHNGAATALLSLAIGLPFLITISTNGGQEAGRVGLSFLLPILFLAATQTIAFSKSKKFSQAD